MNNEYKEIFIENDTLNNIKQDYKPFINHLKNTLMNQKLNT